MLGGPTPFSGQILHPSATGTKLKIHSLNADIPNAPKKILYQLRSTVYEKENSTISKLCQSQR